MKTPKYFQILLRLTLAIAMIFGGTASRNHRYHPHAEAEHRQLSALPEGMECMTDLKVLQLHACNKLLLKGIGELHSLEKLDMRWCLRVRELPEFIKNLGRLKNVIYDEETASL